MCKKATTWASGEKGIARPDPKINVQYDQNVVIGNKVIISNGGRLAIKRHSNYLKA